VTVVTLYGPSMAAQKRYLFFRPHGGVGKGHNPHKGHATTRRRRHRVAQVWESDIDGSRASHPSL
jgi:hypothetical protein